MDSFLNKSGEKRGRDRDRTCDLLVANEALSQLSYTPVSQIIQYFLKDLGGEYNTYIWGINSLQKTYALNTLGSGGKHYD